jgi:hypothetical protein
LEDLKLKVIRDTLVKKNDFKKVRGDFFLDLRFQRWLISVMRTAFWVVPWIIERFMHPFIPTAQAF